MLILLPQPLFQLAAKWCYPLNQKYLQGLENEVMGLALWLWYPFFLLNNTSSQENGDGTGVRV